MLETRFLKMHRRDSEGPLRGVRFSAWLVALTARFHSLLPSLAFSALLLGLPHINGEMTGPGGNLCRLPLLLTA